MSEITYFWICSLEDKELREKVLDWEKKKKRS